MSTILINSGARVALAANGMEALEMVSKFPYDMILMDCQMPVLDGFETTKKIRAMKDPKINNVLIIALTAETDRQKCFEAGMNDYICKPFNKKTFTSVMTKHLLREDT